MNPTKSYKNAILDFIRNNSGATVKSIRTSFSISEPTIFKHLNELLKSKLIKKIGKAPKVIYIINEINYENEYKIESKENAEIIENEFLYIDVIGNISYGQKGFFAWCNNHKEVNYEKTANEYIEIIKKYAKYKNDNIIDATFKLNETFEKVFMDKLFYCDFYAIERFGKTKLAQLSFQAKQSQDNNLMNEIIKIIEKPIYDCIKNLSIDAIGFIPPTVKRNFQFQHALKNMLKISLPNIKIDKIILDTPIQQKTLKRQEDRILNAKSTIFLTETKELDNYSNILLIDDFVGSGATLNETSKKIHLINENIKIYCLALTGSIKGFEVISQI